MLIPPKNKISYRVQFQNSHSKFDIAKFIREGKDETRARLGTKFYKEEQKSAKVSRCKP